MKTVQEKFWETDFGNQYTNRTKEKKFYSTRINMWTDILYHTGDIKNVFEIGSNLGHNMDIIKLLFDKKISTNGIEINKEAAALAKKNHNVKNISVSGGLAASRKLRSAFEAEAARKGINLFYPPPNLCTDNAAMVTCLAAHRYEVEQFDDLTLDAFPNLIT